MSTDLRELAHSVALCLTPSLPYLTTATTSALKGFSEKTGGAAFDLARRLYHMLIPAISENPQADGALIEVSKDPGDSALVGAFELQLRKVFADHENLAGEVSSLLHSEANVTQTLIASGERSVVAKSIARSTVITGNNNTVDTPD